MKSIFFFLSILPLITLIIINVDPNKEGTFFTDSESTVTIYIPLDELPSNSSGVINIFTETKFSLTPLYRKISQNEKSAQSVKESEDDPFKIVIEPFSDGERFRILFKKLEKKDHFLSVLFRKDKETKIYIPPSIHFAHKETTVNDIVEKTHKIKGKNPIYFYIHLRSLKDYAGYEVTRSGISVITFFTENLKVAPNNIYHIDGTINTFNLMELINMNYNRVIMEIFSDVDVSETFIAKKTSVEYYRTLNWENQHLIISTHQIIPKNKDDIHKFILNKDSLASKQSDRYFVNIIHLSGTYNIEYNVYGRKTYKQIQYDKKIYKGNNLISVRGNDTYVFKINCVSKVCLLNFQLIRINTDNMNEFKFSYYTKYFYIYVENKRKFKLASEDDYIQALNSGNYKLYMKDKKGNPKVIENKRKINQFFQLVGNETEIVVSEPIVFMIFHRVREQSPYDDLSKFKDVIGFRYQFNSHDRAEIVSAYLFKIPFHLPDFHYTPHPNKAVGKPLQFHKQLNIDFFNPYLHYDSDIDRNKFALSSCRFERYLKEEEIDILLFTNKTDTLKLRELNRVLVKRHDTMKFLLPLDHDIRNETISDFNLVIVFNAVNQLNGTVLYAIADYIDYHYDSFENLQQLSFDNNGRALLIIEDINLAKGIKLETTQNTEFIIYYTYILKKQLNLVDNSKFEIKVENKKEKNIELSISPFLKSIEIDSEYNVYMQELTNKSDLNEILQTKPVSTFYDASAKEDKIKFTLPLEEKKKYYIVVSVNSLDKSQLDKGIYTLYYDPNANPLGINVNILIGIGACLLFIIAFYCLCCGKNKEDEKKEKGKELENLDEYKKI